MATRALSTALLHADDNLSDIGISSPISVSTTFKTTDDPNRHVYSRASQPTTARTEAVLGELLQGSALTYSSGMSAAYAALVHFSPKRIATGIGYHGIHGAVKIYRRERPDFQLIDLDDEYMQGDLCWLETPLNPTGEAKDIKHYADKVHAAGGKLLVDATFAPPPLLHPFKWGADCVMHSATKYLGGHSDLLCGVLVVQSKEEHAQLWEDRVFLGSVLGSLESFLLLRSLRTLTLRVPRQSATATALAQWLDAIAHTPAEQTFDGVKGGVVIETFHSSLQVKNGRGFDPKEQLEGGHPATFAVHLGSPELAKQLPMKTRVFLPATSLGGVESLMEHRLGTDKLCDPRVVRISIGLEDVEDLRNDIRQAINSLAVL